MHSIRSRIPDWVDVWKGRAEDYNAAGDRFPRARRRERETFLADLRIEPGDTFIDVAAAGGYLLKGVRERFGDAVRIMAIEPSAEHAAALPGYVTVPADSTITRFNLDDNCIDVVANLSGLHHTQDIDRYFTEAFRVLKPGGQIGAADVRKGSAVDAWLNTIVDRYSPHGHKGQFYVDGDFTRMMTDAGFVDVYERRAVYTWDFDNVVDMAVFCKQLFKMQRVEPKEVAEMIEQTLGIVDLPEGGVGMNWELIQAYGKKPAK